MELSIRPRVVLSLVLSVAMLSTPAIAYQANPNFHENINFDGLIIGFVQKVNPDGSSWNLGLKDHEYEVAKGTKDRAWWYVWGSEMHTDRPMRLAFTGLGFPHYFAPVYTYSGPREDSTWHHFTEDEISHVPGCGPDYPQLCRIVVTKQFEKPTVRIARTYPYFEYDLDRFLVKVSSDPAMRVDIIGPPSAKLITIDNGTRSPSKRTVWIHARAHAAETASSYVLEGLINTALSDGPVGEALRTKYVFKILPMVGYDIAQGYDKGWGRDKDISWIFDKNAANPVYLLGSAPSDNLLVNQDAMVPALLDMTAPVSLALNLHSSNLEPDTAAFFKPHFGSDPALYTEAQQALWAKQLSFIRSVASHYDGRIEQPPAEGGAEFLETFFPETWWWYNSPTTNAITLEATYGKGGFDHWVTQDDMRDLGAAVARAIADIDTPNARLADQGNSVFRLPFKPELYQTTEEP